MKLGKCFIIVLAVCVGFLYGSSVRAESSFSANVKLTTDYVFQGASDSDKAPAIQGGFDWSHSTGPYAGVWASNAASSSSDTGASVGGIEIDYYAGYSMKLTDWVGVDVGAMYVDYPEGDSSTSTWEGAAQARLSLNFDVGFLDFDLSYRRVFSDNEQNRLIISASLPIPQSPVFPIILSGKFGINYYDDDEAADNYTWYHVGVGTKLIGFGLEVFYAGRMLTDSDKDDPDPTLGASISRSF